MTKDTHAQTKACNEIISHCNKETIEAAWNEITADINNSDFFSFTVEPTDTGNKVTVWPFRVTRGSFDDYNLYLELLDLPMSDTDAFIKDIYMPFKKAQLKKLCALCITRKKNGPVSASLVVDCRAERDKAMIIRKAYDFCAQRFTEAYLEADMSTFAPARILDELSNKLAEKIR